MYIAAFASFALALQTVRCVVASEGILFPRESETRQVTSLDGIWNFVPSPMNDTQIGFKQHWYNADLSNIPGVEHYLMPVPSSYNDITQNPDVRDHVGVVWYDRSFFVSRSWASKSRVCLRFASVSYDAHVWINGKFVMYHEIGHLPFQMEISSLLNFGGYNKITVACNNTLSKYTVPQGWVDKRKTDVGEKHIQQYSFDFFNYAGIHRPVILYTTPWTYIDDITVLTNVSETTGMVYYNISYISKEDVTCVVVLLNKNGNQVVKQETSCIGTLEVPSVNLWWPYLMDSNPGYLYTLQIQLQSKRGDVLDVYKQPIGVRTIAWTNTTLYINNRPVYMHGFGRHEDADIRGKGLDLPTVLRDYYLIKWVGGNTYRTSHYPYAEEIMDLADQLGIMIIDECPSVNTGDFKDSLLENHKKSLTELIRRDKNRPSVIMWSIANEPNAGSKGADDYFGNVSKHVRSLDNSRPITIAIATHIYYEKVGQHLDIISFNRYNGWYSNAGHLDIIINDVINEATDWHLKYNKPVLISEYGADTISGLHTSPQYIWSEEYQVSLMSKHFKAFDKLRAQGWFIGEFIWNFADFKTAQTTTRIGGNKKGIFTRERQPKAGAHHIRKRYFQLAKELYNATLPEDLYEYVAPTESLRNEL